MTELLYDYHLMITVLCKDLQTVRVNRNMELSTIVCALDHFISFHYIGQGLFHIRIKYQTLGHTKGLSTKVFVDL